MALTGRYGLRLAQGVGMALFLASCAAASGPQNEADGAGGPQAATGADNGSDDELSNHLTLLAREYSVLEEVEDYKFSFVSPAKASAIPALYHLMEARADKAKQKIAKEGTKAKADAAAGGYPYNRHEYSEDWTVTADVPGWLSLYATQWVYSGGAHGMTTFDALIWDKKGKAPLAPLDMFQSSAALNTAVSKEYCDAIDQERAKKRDISVAEVRAQEGGFNECISIDSAALFFESSNSQIFDQIGFLIPPYEAGPYSEGAYEVRVPVNEAIMQVIKPQYRASFAVAR